MAIKDLATPQFDDRNLQQFSDNLKAYLKQFNPVLLDGIFLEKINSSGQKIEITIGTSTTLVPHGLARTYQGWQITDIQGDARVWRDTTSTEDKSLFLPLKASASVVVKLWVF